MGKDCQDSAAPAVINVCCSAPAIGANQEEYRLACTESSVRALHLDDLRMLLPRLDGAVRSSLEGHLLLALNPPGAQPPGLFFCLCPGPPVRGTPRLLAAPRLMAARLREQPELALHL